MKNGITNYTKITLFILFVFLINGNAFGQLISVKKGQYEEIKATTLHFVLTKDYLYDSLLTSYVKQYWTFSKYDFITRDSFLKMCSVDSLYFVILDDYRNNSNGTSSSMTSYNSNTSSWETNTSNSGLVYQDAYTVLTIIKGKTDRQKITEENFSRYVDYGDWIVTVINEQRGNYPLIQDRLLAVCKTHDLTKWYREPVSYKIELDIRSLQFLLEYSKIERKLGFGIRDLLYKFPKVKQIKEGTLYILEDEIPNIQDRILVKEAHPYPLEFITRDELQEKIKNKEKNAILATSCGITSLSSLFTFIDISSGELYFYSLVKHGYWEWLLKYINRKIL